MADISLSEEARRTIDRLNRNLENMVQACMVLSEKADKLDKRIVSLYTMIDDDLGPAIVEANDMLERIDGVATTIIDASKTNNTSRRSSALDALEKIQEIFRIFR